MPTFTFTDSADFDANLEAFLTHMATEDAQMATILRAHVSKLKGTTDEASRRTSRNLFNGNIKAELDSLLTTADKKAGS